MRRSIGKIPYQAAAFSTSSSGGSGRGRGVGSFSRFTADKTAETEPNSSKYEGASPPAHGHGRGRGKLPPSSPILPSFSSIVNNDSTSLPLGRGRGFVPPNSTPQPPQEESEHPSRIPPKSNPKIPFLFVDDEEKQNGSAESEAPLELDKALPGSIMNTLSGAGRGKPIKSPGPQSEKPTVENRHIRRRQSPVSDVAEAGKSSTADQLSKEQKVKKATEILLRGGKQEGGRGTAAVRGGRGASGQRGRGWGRGRGDDRYGEFKDELEEDEDEVPDLDPADEEELTQILGPEKMSQMEEICEEICIREECREAIKDPNSIESAVLNAYDMNLRIECEPEYLMEEFGTNPDIDDKPPIPLRDALEKMKPFLMAYEGIQSQEEWKRVVEETMKKVPLIKEIVDHYSGPDRVTAKEQQEELQRVARTLPASAPDSVKRFTDRAVLSLQNNPGWRFDKKCKFMDKLVREVSQQYK